MPMRQSGDDVDEVVFVLTALYKGRLSLDSLRGYQGGSSCRLVNCTYLVFVCGEW